ncbi:MAG: PIG-L family deacetylase [Myxococcota bacterium]
MMASLTLLLATASDPATLKFELERLRSTQRVLYVAAHPDDENTRLLAYLTGGRGIEAAYLSLTRGGGGQNVIGDEQGGLLSVLRTEELLAARRIDGARQFFTRARDFGYSKTSEETLRIWSERQVVADAVRVVRGFRPDVIITRFRPKGRTHGHHLASARIAQLAFELAADPSYGETALPPWKATRILVNVPRWRNDDDVGDFALDVSGWSALRGQSHPEVAALSRSMHRSQAFGSAPRRGPQLEYFEHTFGERAEKDPLEGVPAGWARFEGGEQVDAALAAASAALGFEPSEALPELMVARAALNELNVELPRVRDGLGALDEIIISALGAWVRVEAPSRVLTGGSTVPLVLRVLQHRGPELQVTAVQAGGRRELLEAPILALGEAFEYGFERSFAAGDGVPAWLLEPETSGSYRLSESADPNLAEDPLTASIELAIRGERLKVRRPVVYPWVDRTFGEREDPVAALPTVVAQPSSEVVWARGSATVEWTVGRTGAELQTRVQVDAPSGWAVSPGFRDVDLQDAEQARVRFTIRPPEGTEPSDLQLVTSTGESLFARRTLAYPHIRPRTILQPSTVRVAPVEVERVKARVGYLMGSGDRVPQALKGLGVEVAILDDEMLRRRRFDGLDVIILGVRAHNVRSEVTAAEPALFDWVKKGGRLIVQYNTNSWYSKLEAQLGPKSIGVDRTRVTNEESPVRILEPEHPFLASPHRIGPPDFRGWVQERGLYFAHEWDEAWTPLLELEDPQESPTQGSLLVLRHGKGHVVFTGLSFFRQLPAGVPGAARLFLNLLGART